MINDSPHALPPFPSEYRASGLLLHVSSLPSPYGIGDVGPAALKWIDQLHEAGQWVRGLERLGKKKWRRNVADVVTRLIAALEPDDVVIGGGNVKKLKELPKGCRVGDNVNAFRGGFLLWEKTDRRRGSMAARTRSLSLRKRKRRKEDDQRNREAH